MIKHFDRTSFGFAGPSVMIWVEFSKDWCEFSLKLTAMESSSLIFLSGVEVGTDVSNFLFGDQSVNGEGRNLQPEKTSFKAYKNQYGGKQIVFSWSTRYLADWILLMCDTCHKRILNTA